MGLGTGRKLTPEEVRQRARAHYEVKYAIQRGIIVNPRKCEDCKADIRMIEAHHEDYSKPLEVRWLCRPCHNKADRKWYETHI